MLPFTLGGSLGSIIAGMLIGHIGSYRSVTWGGWVIMTLGWGLMITLNDTSNVYDMYHSNEKQI